MKLINNVLFMLLTVGMFSGCIKEDMDDCPKYSVNTLSLSYKGDGTTEIFNDKIEQVVMYVFDQNEKLVTTKVLTKEEVTQRSVQLSDLEPATYRVICMGNMIEDQVNDLYCEDCDEIYCAAPEYFKKQVIPGNAPLYYASLNLTVTEDDQQQTVRFDCSHYKVAVEVVGLYTEGVQPVVELCGVLPYTTFENKAGGEAITYMLENEYNDGQMTVRTNIMRHTDHEGVDVCLRDAVTGRELKKINLAEFLTANPVIDCTKQEVLIAIRFEFKSLDCVVTVPEWAIEIIKPEF